MTASQTALLRASRELYRKRRRPITESIELLASKVITEANEDTFKLRQYLDGIEVTSQNIGEVRRRLFHPWECAWNGIVRDETAVSENRNQRK